MAEMGGKSLFHSECIDANSTLTWIDRSLGQNRTAEQGLIGNFDVSTDKSRAFSGDGMRYVYDGYETQSGRGSFVGRASQALHDMCAQIWPPVADIRMMEALIT